MELDKLLPLLRANGVRKFNGLDLEIELDSAVLPEAAAPAQVQRVPDPPGMPPDLRDPDLMSEDKIRDWSGSPAHDDDVAPLPMTGDAPIKAPG